MELDATQPESQPDSQPDSQPESASAKLAPFILTEYDAYMAFIFIKDQPMHINWNGLTKDNFASVVNMIIEYVILSDPQANAAQLHAYISDLAKAVREGKLKPYSRLPLMDDSSVDGDDQSPPLETATESKQDAPEAAVSPNT